VNQGTRQLGQQVLQIEVSIHPTLDIHMRKEHTNQGKRIQLEQMGLQRCAKVVGLTNNRNTKPSA
jgi:hypothetical protein